MDLGIVATGHRAQGHIQQFYEIRDQHYFQCNDDIQYPHRIDHDYTDKPREWAEDISDLTPRITALFDPSSTSLEQAEAICTEHGDQPQLFSDFDDFLAFDGYDAALVSSPNQHHASQSIELLERDIDTFCEKPIAISVEDHDRIIDAERSSTALYYVGFNLRCSPLYTRIKSLIEDGAIGNLGMLSCRESRGHFHADYSFSSDLSGGTLIDKSCHDFDLYNWYADADPVRVYAIGNQHFHQKNTDVTDQTVITIEYENGVLATMELCMYAPFGQRVRMYELRGSEGVLRAPNKNDEITLFRRGSRDTFREVDTAGGHGGADPRQAKRFLQCLHGDAEPPASAVDAKKADVIALAGELSIQRGEPITIDSQYNIVDLNE